MNASKSNGAAGKECDKSSSWENKNSLAIRLLKVVFSIYLLITVCITAVQMLTEYRSEKETIVRNFSGYQDIFYEGVANALWNYDINQLNAMIDGMDELHDITGVKIFDADNRLLVTHGEVSHEGQAAKHLWSGLFSHAFEIEYFDEKIGSVVFFSSEAIVFNKVKESFIVILINATIKTIILWFLFIWAFKRYLVAALDSFISRMEDMDFDRATPSYLKLDTFQSYELSRFEAVFNDMNERIYHSKASLETLNDDLEHLVEERTRKIRVQQAILEEMSLQGRMGAWEIDLVEHKIYWSTMVRNIHEVAEDYQPDLIDVMSFIKRSSDRDIINRHLSECIDHTTPWQLEMPIITNAGNEVWVAMTGRGIFEDDQCVRMIGSYQDIDATVRTQQQLKAAKEEAVSAARMKSEFLATMSHEIRTPMNGVLGMLHLLTQTSLTEQQLHYAELAESSGKSLLGLINDILDFSKVEAGRIELEHLPFNLGTLLEDVVLSLGPKAQEKGLELMLDTASVSQGVYAVIGDAGRLRQVLVNLIGNAIKFTSEGQILVTVSVEKKAQDLMQLKVDVTDTGIGIDPEKLPHIFELFTQVDASTTRKYGGTGLGLAISRQLCQLMGGDITAVSELAKGSTFQCTIDLLTAPVEAVNGCANEHSDSSTNISTNISTNGSVNKSTNDCATEELTCIKDKTFLLVETNPEVFKVLARYIALYQGQAVQVASLIEVADTLAAHALSQDILIIDAQAMVHDPTGFANIQRATAAQDIPTLILQPFGAHESEDDAGASAHYVELAKPLTHGGFVASMQKLHRVQAHRKATDSRPKTPMIDTGMTVPPSSSSAIPMEPSMPNHTSLDHQWPREYRVLLVEDNHINQMVAQGILDSLGVAADIADNGRQAIDRLLDQPAEVYDLILMDCQMPEMDGYEATRLIRQGEAGLDHCSMPIVAMTANAMKGDKEKCLAIGMDDYMTKPIDASVLLQKLQQWLPSS